MKNSEESKILRELLHKKNYNLVDKSDTKSQKFFNILESTFKITFPISMLVIYSMIACLFYLNDTILKSTILMILSLFTIYFFIIFLMIAVCIILIIYDATKRHEKRLITEFCHDIEFTDTLATSPLRSLNTVKSWLEYKIQNNQIKIKMVFGGNVAIASIFTIISSIKEYIDIKGTLISFFYPTNHTQSYTQFLSMVLIALILGCIIGAIGLSFLNNRYTTCKKTLELAIETKKEKLDD